MYNNKEQLPPIIYGVAGALYGFYIVVRGVLLGSTSDVWFGTGVVISGGVYILCSLYYNVYTMLLFIVLGFGVASLIVGIVYLDKVHASISISNISIVLPIICKNMGLNTKSYIIWQIVFVLVGALLVYFILRNRNIQNVKGEKYEI